MKCDRAQEFFSDYLERTLDRPMAAALETHLRECTACREDLEFLGDTVRSLSLMPEVEPPVNGDQEVIWTLRRLHEQRVQAERNRPSFLAWLQGLGPARTAFAAGLATLVIAGSYIGVKQSGQKAATVPVPLGPTRTASASDLRLRVIYGEAADAGQAVTFRLTPSTRIPDLTVSLNGDGLPSSFVAPAMGPIEAGKDVDLPLTVAVSEGSNAQVFRVKAASVALKMEREFVVAVPAGKREPRLVTLAMSYQTLDGALKQLGEFVDRPIIADAALGNQIQFQIDRAQPEVALKSLATQLKGQCLVNEDAYVLTSH
jgi:hypothetical protein